MSEKIERVEDLEFGWVLKAESVWKSTQWVKILHKTVQESNETLITSEIEGLKVWPFFFFFFFFCHQLIFIITMIFILILFSFTPSHDRIS